MNDIDKIEAIKRSELSEVNYITSLISKGHEKELLDRDDVEKLQIQTLELLKLRSERYIGNESTSIAAENAEKIMKSNLYTMGVYLKRFNPDEGIGILKNSSFVGLYNEGLKCIYRKIKVTKTLHYKVLKTRVFTDNETYNSTITGGIKGFFKIYDPEFEAYNMKITADYPLYNNLIGKLEGIEFIEKYLQYICYENEFCNKFSIESIKHLLLGYAEDYKELLINIFTIVLTSAIGCGLAGENIGRLTVSVNGLKKIDEILKNMSKDEMYKAIFEEYTKIKNILRLNNNLDYYIRENFEEIQFTIYNAVEKRFLDRVFIVQKFIL